MNEHAGHPRRLAHALGSRVVPDPRAVPVPAGRAGRSTARPARRRSQLQVLPSRRPDHRARGLPRDPARAGAAAAKGDRGRPHPDRPLVRDAGRVSRQRRVAGPQPAARPSHLAGVRHADAGRLPAGSVRPRRPDAADLAAVRPRQHDPLARLRRRERRVLVGRAGRLAAADDAPAAGGLLQRDAHRVRSRCDDGAREGEGRLRARRAPAPARRC